MNDETTPFQTKEAAIAPDPAKTARLMKSATLASVSVATVLILAKVSAWIATDSVAMLSTLIDSLLDAGASAVSFFAVRHALTPADREHRFGHGKAEPLAGLAQSAFIAGSGIFLVLESIDRVITPHAVVNGEIGMAVMGFSLIVTVALVAYQGYVIRATGSVAVSADALHYRVDILVNLAVIVSLYLSTHTAYAAADPLFALGIVAYMFWGAFKIARQSLDYLMDREFPDEDRRRIREIAMAHPGVLDVHDLRTRSSGPQAFIQLHLEMSRDLSLIEAHSISDEVMYEVEKAFPQAEVLIHQDPEGIDERRDDI